MVHWELPDSPAQSSEALPRHACGRTERGAGTGVVCDAAESSALRWARVSTGRAPPGNPGAAPVGKPVAAGRRPVEATALLKALEAPTTLLRRLRGWGVSGRQLAGAPARGAMACTLTILWSGASRRRFGFTRRDRLRLEDESKLVGLNFEWSSHSAYSSRLVGGLHGRRASRGAGRQVCGPTRMPCLGSRIRVIWQCAASETAVVQGS
jgi:hypothetical protein